MALRHAEQAHAKTIRTLDLRVGALSRIVGESVEFYSEMISRGTLAEGAQLRIEIVPPHARCRACGAECALPFEADGAGVWLAQLESLELCRQGDAQPGQGCSRAR
jgi:hydrogenase nickel incorporation protein HypA/HybF